MHVVPAGQLTVQGTVHVPPTHERPAAQAMPQRPQFAAFVLVSTQPPPQQVCVPVHAVPAPQRHVPDTHVSPVSHAGVHIEAPVSRTGPVSRGGAPVSGIAPLSGLGPVSGTGPVSRGNGASMPITYASGGVVGRPASRPPSPPLAHAPSAVEKVRSETTHHVRMGTSKEARGTRKASLRGMQGSRKHDHLVGYERSSDHKLRVAPLTPPLRVVLVEPEIPPNTGSIARTCAATQSALHLVEPPGFRIDERSVRRAGIDYWHLVDLHVHASFEAFEAAHPDARVHLLSANGTRSIFEAELRAGDALVFGRESVGLPNSLCARFASSTWSIPTAGAVRSLNLSNAVSVVVFEALRQAGALRGARVVADPPEK